MSDLRESLTAQAAGFHGLSWLAPYRKASIARMTAAQWPEPRVEHWKHSPVKRLHAAMGALTSDRVVSATGDDLIPGLTALRYVFVDGQFDAAASTLDGASSITLVPFSKADSTQQASILAHLGQSLDSVANREQHLFADVNGAMLRDGLFIHVPKNVHFEKTIEVVYRSQGNGSVNENTPRLLVVLEAGAQAHVVEHFVNATQAAVMVNALTEINLKANARLNYYHLAVDQHEIVHVGGVHVLLNNDAVINGFILSLGSLFKRTDMVVHHRGQGSHCDLAGLYLTRGEEHSDLNACIEHRTPHCFTDEVFRGILADRSKAVFNGRIHIHPQAQKTLANLSNKNLLLDQGAEIYTKPELEIYADDVRCSHGATVSEIQSDALYYLQTRGISRKEAEIMLSYGFINEVLNTIQLPALREHLQMVLATQFTRDTAILEHLG